MFSNCCRTHTLDPAWIKDAQHHTQPTVGFLSSSFFFLHIFYLFYVFTFQMLSPFPVSLPETSCLAPHPTRASMRVLPHPLTQSHTPTLAFPYMGCGWGGNRAFTGPRASPPIDARQGHLLLYIQLESWVPPCVLFGGLVPGSLGVGGQLVDIVDPMGLQSPSAPSVLLNPPLGSPCSVQWLATYIRICISQALAEPLRRQLYQAPILLFLTSTILFWVYDIKHQLISFNPV